jgi:hypothetical protein
MMDAPIATTSPRREDHPHELSASSRVKASRRGRNAGECLSIGPHHWLENLAGWLVDFSFGSQSPVRVMRVPAYHRAVGVLWWWCPPSTHAYGSPPDRMATTWSTATDAASIVHAVPEFVWECRV